MATATRGKAIEPVTTGYQLRMNVYRSLLSCALLALPFYGGVAYAADWDTAFSVAPGVVFTDNTCLDDDDKQSEWIGTLTPRVRLTGDGARANVAFTGSLRFNTLDNNDTKCRNNRNNNADSPIPTAQFSGQSELIENWLYLDATANARQNTINEFRAGGSDGLNRSGNTNTTAQYRVNPYLYRRFKSYADFRLGYFYDEQWNSENIVGDNTRERVDLTLSSLEYFSPLTWSVTAYQDEVDYDDDNRNRGNSNNELRAVTLRLGYQFDRKWQINGSIGEEDNDFVSNRDDIDGRSWDVGFLFTPNTRTSIGAGYGDRFFGSTPRFNISHRHKRSLLFANYQKDLTYNRELRGFGGIDSQFLDLDETGEVVVEDDLEGFGIPTSLSRSPIVNEQLTVGYRLNGRRSTLSINGRRSDQRRTDINDDSTFNGASINLSYRLGRNLNPYIRLSWDKRESDVRRIDGNDSETWRAGAGVTRSLSSSIRFSVNYLYTDRDSEGARDSYKENRVTATFRINL